MRTAGGDGKRGAWMDARSLKGTAFVGRAYNLTFQDIGRIVPSMLLWSLPLLAWLAWPMVDRQSFLSMATMLTRSLGSDGGSLAFGVLTASLQAACVTGFCVQRHRELLARVLPLRRSAAASWAPYLGYWLLTTLAIIAVGAVIGLVFAKLFGPQSRDALLLGILAGLIVVAMFVLRAILVFPAIAIGDKSMTLSAAERITRGNGWRILLESALVTIPIAVVLGVLVELLGNSFVTVFPDGTGLFLSSAANFLLDFVIAAVFVTYVSLLYAHFSGLSLPDQAAQETPQS